MEITPQALYIHLLRDLEPHVTPYAYECMLKRKVDFYPGATVRDITCMQLAASILKKYEDGSSAVADTVALDKFLAANLRCGNWQLQLSSLLDEALVGAFKQSVYTFLHPNNLQCLVPDDLVSLMFESDLVGPGASIGASGYDFYSKLFAGRLSCTSHGLYASYRSYIKSLNPDWVDAENIRQTQFGETLVVSGNRLSFVPKSYDCSRVICTEPLLNMLVQKGIGNILERRLRHYFGIDLASQQAKNRELARIGSQTGEFVTIDLSSASDTISNQMLKAMLPKGFFSLLQFCRSPETTVMMTGEKLALNMVSTMGNGFTFPLQTMLFACVVEAVVKVTGCEARDFDPPRGGNLGSYGVNGDDIVCRREVARCVIRLLELLGFEVNPSKSFLEGPFRESCGGDFFKGLPVRGVYVNTLKDANSRYSAINALNDWSARSLIPLCATIQLLLRSVRYLPVPVWEDPSAGVRVPWNLVSGLRRSKHTGSVIYTRLVFEPVRLRIKDCQITVPRGARKRIFNPYGLLISFLRGTVRGTTRKGSDIGTITIRHDSGWFRPKRGVAPNWEATDTVQPLSDLNWSRSWKWAVQCNLERG